MLYVEKGGEIIPKIVGVDEKRRQPGSQPIAFVTHCPSCGTQLVRVEGEAAWVCPNKWGCGPQICGRIEHFVGRHAMDIDGIGEEVAVILNKSGLVNDVADLYDLTQEKLVVLDRFTTSSPDPAGLPLTALSPLHTMPLAAPRTPTETQAAKGYRKKRSAHRGHTARHRAPTGALYSTDRLASAP